MTGQARSEKSGSRIPRKEWGWLAFNLVGSLICAVAIAVAWGWNVYVVWAVIFGACHLVRVYRLARHR